MLSFDVFIQFFHIQTTQTNNTNKQNLKKRKSHNNQDTHVDFQCTQI